MGESAYKPWEDIQNVILFVSDSGHQVGGGIRGTDDGRGTILPVETASVITVFIVWEGDGVGVAGSPPTYTAREGNRGETTLGYHAPLWIATHL